MTEIHTKRGALAWLLLLAALSGGCEEWWGEDEEDPELDASMNPGTTGDAAAEAGTAPGDAGPDAAPGVDGGVMTADAAVDAAPAIDAAPVVDAAPVIDAAPAVDAGPPDAAPEAAAADATPEAAAPATELPCDVAQVLEARCQGCHGNPPSAAPMPLVTLEDLKATSTTFNVPTYERVQVRVDNNTMPPSWASTGQLSSSEKATLLDWIEAGAPGSSNVCP